MINTQDVSCGYDLYNVFDNQWVIDLKNGNAYHGDFKEVFDFMTTKLGFDKFEVLDASDKYGGAFNALHFGVFKTCIYPFNKEINIDKAS